MLTAVIARLLNICLRSHLTVVVRHSKENTGGGHGRREKGMFSLTGIRNRAYRLFLTYRQVIIKITPQRLFLFYDSKL